MAHPFHHSLSSVRSFGGQVSDYIEIHSWLDSTKELYANFRHRALRHHNEGAAHCEKFFGQTIVNSDKEIVRVHNITLQHIEEDCERSVSAVDWLTNMKAPRWFVANSFPSKSNSLEYLLKRFGNEHAGSIGKLLDFFYGFENMVDSPLWMALRSNSHGIYEAEKLCGYTFTNDNNNASSVPIRYAAEELIRFQLNRIPSAQDWLSHIESKPWMIRTKKIIHTL